MEFHLKTFLLTALLHRYVQDTMSIKVRAQSPEHAYEIARTFLPEFPDKTTYSDSVPFCIVENREILSSEIVELEHGDGG